jgi:hypothetical protein
MVKELTATAMQSVAQIVFESIIHSTSENGKQRQGSNHFLQFYSGYVILLEIHFEVLKWQRYVRSAGKGQSLAIM